MATCSVVHRVPKLVVIQLCSLTSILSSQDLVEICCNCSKAFNKERDKSHIVRAVIAKFVEALKYKTSIPDVNFLYLSSMMLQDARGELPPSSILEVSGCQSFRLADHVSQEVPRLEPSLAGPVHTGSTPYLECYLPDIVEFVADVHTLSKVKSHVRGLTIGLNQDTLGGCLKAALSQVLAAGVDTALYSHAPPCIEMRGMKDNFIFFIKICFFLFILTFLMKNIDITLTSDINFTRYIW